MQHSDGRHSDVRAADHAFAKKFLATVFHQISDS